MENIDKGLILSIIDAVAIVGTTVYLNNKITEIKNESLNSKKPDVGNVLKIFALEKKVINIDKKLQDIDMKLNFLMFSLKNKGILDNIKVVEKKIEEINEEDIIEDDDDDDVLLALKNINNH